MSKICTAIKRAPKVKAWETDEAKSDNWNRNYVHVECDESELPDGARLVHCRVCSQTMILKKSS